MLIADKDSELCDLYGRSAARLGYEVETAPDGLACLAKLRRVTPAVLVLDLDIDWGGVDGILGWLQAEPQFLPGRIVLTSAETAAHVFDRMTLSPVVETLTKPFPLSALLEASAVPSDKPVSPANDRQRRGILVVDDKPIRRDSLPALLNRHGFLVWLAGSGEEALDHCCDHGEEILVILLNVQATGLDVPHTLEGIRACEVEIPVCFFGANSGTQEPKDLMPEGGHHLFATPYCMDEMVRTLCNLANEPVCG